MSAPPSPARVAIFPNGELAVVWSDGHESYYPGRLLRLGCHCAKCVDEMTGRKLLREERVPSDVRPTGCQEVGRYGLGVRFSDGHDTGIYTYERLRSLCPCCA